MGGERVGTPSEQLLTLATGMLSAAGRARVTGQKLGHRPCHAEPEGAWENLAPLPAFLQKTGLEVGPAWPETTLVNGRTGPETRSSLALASDIYTTASPIRGPADSGLRLARPKVPQGMVVWAIGGADAKMGLC